MEIHSTNWSITYPRGIIEDLLIKVGKFVFPFDFIVLEIEEDGDILFILRRPFISSMRALVDIHDSKTTLRVGSKEITFGFD